MLPDPELEPSAAELAAIEAEWPLIGAELAVTDAEAAIAAGCGGVLGRSRLAAAERRLEAVAAGFVFDPVSVTYRPAAQDAADLPIGGVGRGKTSGAVAIAAWRRLVPAATAMAGPARANCPAVVVFVDECHEVLAGRGAA
ncbi:DUF6284 family protein [Pseudofrankia asymbiotica]|uniref:Uncharacterized protein n=1 Tax=Pseudofrankia asymbiotica TaxID=1834516 RepID=A0A1V2I1M1_9ACTN|nr:DUF6284 family protein [Pseudofrankia asymbiotica]ONH23820.1 hypothetical protein BL253_31885 [Pseudofrankia asymbiotica]